MSKNGSIVYQVERILKDKMAFGESKHEAKKYHAETENIFTFNTAKAYLDSCIKFVTYCRQNYGCRTVPDCEKYVKRYLREVRQKNGKPYSAHSLASKASAIAKMYGTKKVKTDKRNRSDITRSRKPVEQDRHYNPENHKETEAFLRSTGLRRNEAEHITGTQLVKFHGVYYVHIVGNQAKGGRERYARVIGNVDLVIRMMNAAGTDKVFGRLPSAMDVHSIRAKYAADMYRMLARDLDTCKKDKFFDSNRNKLCADSVYWCRKDLSGVWFDKKAMLIVSRSLGHNRISVIAENYLYSIAEEQKANF